MPDIAQLEQRLGQVAFQVRGVFAKHEGESYDQMPEAAQAELKRLFSQQADLEAELAAVPASRNPWATTTPKGVTAPSGGFVDALVSEGLSLKSKPSVSIPGVTLKATSLPSAELWNQRAAGVPVPLPRDARFLWPHLVFQDAGNTTSIADFTETVRSVTGSIERALDATTDKAVLNITIAHAVEELVQEAVVIEGVPNAVLEANDSMRAFLEQDARFVINQAIDEHVLSRITAATPPFGATGDDLLSQIRNAVAAMHANGASPSILALDPATAVELDLSAQPTSGDYLFPSRATGTSSPIWGLTVVEVAAMVGEDPLLIDPDRLGVMFLGALNIALDPFGSNFRKNLTDLRAELSCLFHVRADVGTYRIAAA